MRSPRLKKSDLLQSETDRKVLVEASHVYRTRHELAYLRTKFTLERWAGSFRTYLDLIIYDRRGWGEGMDVREIKRYALKMAAAIDKEKAIEYHAERLPRERRQRAEASHC